MPVRSRGAFAARIRPVSPYVVDAAVTVAVAVPVSVAFVTAQPGGVTALGVLLNAGTVVPLFWRRRWPFVVAVVAALFALLVSLHHTPGQALPYGLLVAMYTVADLALPWQRRAFAAAVIASLLVEGLLLKDYLIDDFTLLLLLPLTAYLVGALVRTSRAREEALEDRARQLDRERAADAARIAAEERAHVARDMHDILAHGVSMMVVQAEAGPVVIRIDPDRAERIFDAIASSGRDAMTQLRRVLGVLREDPTGRAPQPRIEQIPELLRTVRGAGLWVDLVETGSPRSLSADAEIAAFRIVQEALTNAIKHAGASSAQVRFDWDDTGLTLSVTDDGRGPATAGSDGRGIIGIRERAIACGGRAQIGPGPGGGFRVLVALPVVALPVAAL